MSYLGKVELWRARHQEIEIRNKKRKARARKAGMAGALHSTAHRTAVQSEGGWRWLRNMLDTMDPRTWKSRATIISENAARRRAEREAAKGAEKEKKATT